jgi:NitT/TauT family transport system substrate-binding protein
MSEYSNIGLSRSFSRRQMLRGMGLGAAALTLPAVLAACGSSSKSSSGGSGGSGGSAGSGTTTLSYQLEWLKITQFAGFFAAEENGYYAKQGINAKIAAGGPNISASQLVAAGKADLGDDDNITLLQGIDKGLPLVMFAAIFQKTPESCISLSSAPIHTLQDMVGKTIAIDPAEQAQLEPALKDAGIDPSKVKFIPSGTDPTQLTTKQADGYFGFSTSQGVQLQQQGVDIVVTSVSDLGFGDYADVLFTTKSNLASKKDDLVKFLRATIMGYEYTAANPDKAAQMTVSKYGPSGLVLANETAVAKTQIPLIDSPKGVLWLDPDEMQKIITQQVSIKSISKPLSVSDVMTTEILEAAYGGKTNLLN